MAVIRALKFKPFKRGTLRCFVDRRMTSGELLKYRNGLVMATSLARPGTSPEFL